MAGHIRTRICASVCVYSVDCFVAGNMSYTLEWEQGGMRMMKEEEKMEQRTTAYLHSSRTCIHTCIHIYNKTFNKPNQRVDERSVYSVIFPYWMRLEVVSGGVVYFWWHYFCQES